MFGVQVIRLSKSSISDKEIENVARVLRAEYLGMGEEVGLFEKELQSYFSSNVACVNTGTAALHLAFQALDLKTGDEVLCPTITFLGTFQSIAATGAKPIPCEVLESSILLDLDDAKKKLTNNTKAICLVHYAGNPGNLTEYYEFAKAHNLRIVEDAAHAFGTTYNGNLIGSIGDVVCFSFDGIKNITSGEGGAVVSKDDLLISRIRDLRLLGIVGDSERRYKRERSWTFDVAEQGWRYHMSDVMAAIGRMQFQRFSEFSKKRKALSQYYVDKIRTMSLPITLVEMDYDIVTPHIFVVKVEASKREPLKEFLLSNKIQTGVHYLPNHRLSFVKKISGNFPCPKSDAIYEQILTLPLHFDLTYSDLDFILDKIKEFYCK